MPDDLKVTVATKDDHGTGRMIDCTQCLGRGWTQRIGQIHPWECEACKGTGKQEVLRAR